MLCESLLEVPYSFAFKNEFLVISAFDDRDISVGIKTRLHQLLILVSFFYENFWEIFVLRLFS
jgi:hypothetical protein